MFIFENPLALLELRLTADILRGGLIGAVFGDTPKLLVGWGMVVVTGVLEVIELKTRRWHFFITDARLTFNRIH